MKGEFRDKDSHPSLSTTTMFSTLHHHQPPPPTTNDGASIEATTTNHHHRQAPPQPPTTISHHLTTTTNDGASIDATTTNHHLNRHYHHQPPPPTTISHHLTTTTTNDGASIDATTNHHQNRHHHQPTPTTINHHLTTTTNDGASIEVIRRPRGRPPGSRNKPKPPPPPPLTTTTNHHQQQPNSSMSPYVLEIAGGLDIISAISQFSNHRNTTLCVLSGCGSVSNVTFQQSTIAFQGRFELLSISATVSPLSSAVQTPLSNRFAISLAGPRGETIGGAVTGPLIAAGTVYIVAASFNNPLYHRLPMEEEKEEEDDHIRSSGGGGDIGGRRQNAPPYTAADSDVIWAPTPRLAQPHSPKDCFF